MIDIETLGTSIDCAFISIGACLFNPFSGEVDTKNTFYRRIDWDSALKCRSFETSTIRWWLKQNQEAREEICKRGQPLDKVLADLHEWLPFDPIVWGNGSNFDIAILDHAYNGDPKWKFWNIRDVRTVVDIASGIVDRPKMEGVCHNALEDTIHQAKYVCKMVQKLREGK